jgi:hypothetical protein
MINLNSGRYYKFGRDEFGLIHFFLLNLVIQVFDAFDWLANCGNADFGMCARTKF